MKGSSEKRHILLYALYLCCGFTITPHTPLLSTSRISFAIAKEAQET
jgi:hypothetical protein